MLSNCNKINQYSPKGCVKNINIYSQRIDKIKNKIEWSKLKIEGYSLDHLEIKATDFKGLGVFAKKEIKAGEIIEYCHCIALSYKSKMITDPSIIQYYYSCPPKDEYGMSGLIPLGFGGIYNTSEDAKSANAYYVTDYEDKTIFYIALNDIKASEEICVWHGERYYNAWIASNKPKKLTKQELKKLNRNKK